MKTKNLIHQFGNGTTLATALGITRGAITQWGDDVPRKWQLEVKERWPKKYRDAINAGAEDEADKPNPSEAATDATTKPK